MSVTYTWDVQAYISGAWVSIKRDVEVFKAPTVAMRGISGSKITDRVATPGSLSLSLDNGESNSAGLLGYYSPKNANMRSNFGTDTKIRIKLTYSGTDKYIWCGRISELDPDIGQFRTRSTKLAATDYMQQMVEQKLNKVSVQQDQRSDQIITTLLGAMSNATANTSITTDKMTLPFALSAEMDEKTTVMGAVQKVCQTVLGYFFVKGDATDGETAVFQLESERAAATSALTLDDTMSEMKLKRSTDQIKNKITGKIHPTRVDDEPTTLIYELDNEVFVDGGDTHTFTFRFKDPASKATRISALDVVTPLVADTHYRASKFEDTTYNDANGDLSITDTNGANSADWAVENTSGVRVFLNLINIFGRGIYYYNAIDVVASTGSADRETNYDFFYLSDQMIAAGFLHRLLERASSSDPDVESVSFYADENATLMNAAMTLDIGSCITCTETVSGIDNDYIINKVTYTFETNGALKLTYELERADENAYFILDSSLLDGTDVLSPY